MALESAFGTMFRQEIEAQEDRHRPAGMGWSGQCELGNQKKGTNVKEWRRCKKPHFHSTDHARCAEACCKAWRPGNGKRLPGKMQLRMDIIRDDTQRCARVEQTIASNGCTSLASEK